jgi:hypothetical protein
MQSKRRTLRAKREQELALSSLLAFAGLAFCVPLIVALAMAWNANYYLKHGVLTTGRIEQFFCPGDRRSRSVTSGGTGTVTVFFREKCSVQVSYNAPDGRLHYFTESQEDPRDGFRQGDTVPVVVLPPVTRDSKVKARLNLSWSLWSWPIGLGLASLPFAFGGGVCFYLFFEACYPRSRKRIPKITPTAAA